jgi:quercetin dioxygenase-like cupin family protein
MKIKGDFVMKHPLAIIAGSVLLAAAAFVSLPVGANETGDETVRPIISVKLPNVPGKSLSAALVTYPPGGKSGKHHHAGSVFAFVVSGAIQSENSATGPVKVYKAGEAFFEPPGSEHLVSANASETEPASLLAVFVADDDAKLTTPDK